jgi:hypothetical protein
LMKEGRAVEAFRTHVEAAITAAQTGGNRATAQALAEVLDDWRRASEAVAATRHPEPLANSYMRLTGLVAFGAAWAKLERNADKAPNSNKIRTLARFVSDFMLPEAQHHARMCLLPLRLDDVSPAIFQVS